MWRQLGVATSPGCKRYSYTKMGIKSTPPPRMRGETFEIDTRDKRIRDTFTQRRFLLHEAALFWSSIISRIFVGS